jgi:hypothetical protein
MSLSLAARRSWTITNGAVHLTQLRKVACTLIGALVQRFDTGRVTPIM